MVWRLGDGGGEGEERGEGEGGLRKGGEGICKRRMRGFG